MAAQDLEKSKILLKKAGIDGQSVYDHLTKVLLKIQELDPADPVAAFEEISVKVKQHTVTPATYKEFSREVTPAAKAALAKSIQKTSSLIKPNTETGYDKAFLASAPKPPKNEEDEDEHEKELQTAPVVVGGTLTHIPDIVAQSDLLKWGGCNLDKEEMYKISLAMHDLARREKLASVRFFGKIFGLKRDYIIVEAKAASVEKEPVDRETLKEAAGRGANEFVFYVSNGPETEFSRLPDVLPDQIILARQMRRYFSGDLTAAVKGYPRFPWPEASYLRAQIARIAAATLVSPKGFFSSETLENENEEDEEEVEVIVEDPGYEAPSAAELLESDAWCHHRSWLSKKGRCQAYVKPEEEEDDEDEEKEDEEEEEPEEEEDPIENLRDLGSDELPADWKPPEDEEEEEEDEESETSAPPVKLWSIKQVPTGVWGKTEQAATKVTNLVWPGAVCVAKGKNFANVYIGYGHRLLKDAYTPPPPPTVQTEFVSKFNPEEAEEGETDPTIELVDPLPPRPEGDEGDDEDEGDGGSDDEED